MRRFIFLAGMTVLLAGRSGARDFDVRAYGAAGDGKTKDTLAIQKAIDACHAYGGGRVILEGGTFLTAPITLKGGVDLHLDVTARLLGSPDLADYPNRTDIRHVDVRYCDRYRNASLIFAEECENVAISGRGVIDGNGMAFVRRKTDQANSRYPGFAYELKCARTNSLPRMLFFAGVRNLSVTDVTIRESPAAYVTWVHDCDLVRFHKVNVLANMELPNNDGIHLNCCRDVMISDCYLETGDDSIVVRAHSASLREDKPSERVTVVNCIMRSWCSGVRIGWVNDGTIRDCTFSNLVMYDCTKGISIQMGGISDETDMGDHGHASTLIENITFSNIIMDRIYTHPLMIDTVENPATKLTGVRDIRFSHIHSRALEKNPVIVGRSTNPFRNFQFDNCTFDKLEEKDLPLPWDRHGCSSYNRRGDVPPRHCVGFSSDAVTRRSWPAVAEVPDVDGVTLTEVGRKVIRTDREPLNFCFAQNFPDGTIWLGHSIGRHTVTERGTSMISRDNGKTWAIEEDKVWAMKDARFGMNGFLTRDGLKRSANGWVLTPTNVSEITVTTVSPDGKSTTAKTRIDLPEPMQLRLHRNVTRLANGKLILTGYTRCDKPFRCRAYVVESDDDGLNWHFLSWLPDVAEAQEGLNEGTSVQRKDGTVLAFVRTGNKYGGREGVVALMRFDSKDGGKTWSGPKKVADYGVDPLAFYLSDGTLALLSGRPGIYLLLDPTGTGDHFERHELYKGPGSSYSTVMELAPGELTFIYDESSFANRKGESNTNRIVQVKYAYRR